MSTTCPACGEAELRTIAELRGVPVHCNVLYDNAESARAAVRGDIELGFCDVCAMLFNTAFDPTLLRYDQEYENSLHFSARFQGYAEGLARQLLERHGGTDLDIIELGCGKGDFLRLLTANGANRCRGFDASFDERINPTADVAGLTIESEFYSPETHSHRADLLISRHVLEHIEQPTEFVRTMGSGLKTKPSARIFFEVPNGLWTVRDLGIWDLIFEHCSYFTEPALARVFTNAGFHPQRIFTSFSEQFLCIEAARSPSPLPVPGTTVEDIRQLAESFGSHLTAKIHAWETRLEKCRTAGQRAVIWGTGSKGVTFLNVVQGGADLVAAIDINPRKTGRFVPGTGQQIHAPAWLTDQHVDLVLVMNPVYENEIQETLRSVGSAAVTETV